jgi:hypothetical protein
MSRVSLPERKPPVSVTDYDVEPRLLVGRREAARMLSISVRAVDYLIAHRELATRRIGTRVLVSAASIRQYARADHPQRLAS